MMFKPLLRGRGAGGRTPPLHGTRGECYGDVVRAAERRPYTVRGANVTGTGCGRQNAAPTRYEGRGD